MNQKIHHSLRVHTVKPAIPQQHKNHNRILENLQRAPTEDVEHPSQRRYILAQSPSRRS